MRRIHELLDRWADEAPDRLACIDHDGSRFTYVDFATSVDEAADLLRESGVVAGDRVMILGENALALVAFVLACSKLDAWAIPVNARVTVDEIERIRAHAEPHAMVFAHQASEAAGEHSAVFGAVETGDHRFGRVRIAGGMASVPEESFEAAGDQVAALIYTTGTTGNAKGVMLTHGNLLYMSRISRDIRGLSPADHIYGVLPVTHIFAFAAAFLAALRAGAVLEFVPRFDPAAVFAAIARGVTVMPAVPQMYALLLKHAAAEGIETIDAPKLRYISSGGAPLDPDWKRRVEAFFGISLHNGYGMTEAAPGIAATRFGEKRDDVSVGPPLPEQEVRLVPPPGQSGLQDGVGEIVTRGPNVMKGYYRNPEETAKAIDADGFLHTGDLGRFTEDGALTIVGRCKELIIRSGFNVYPPEVEAALNRHPAVTQSAVVGRRLPDGNEEVLPSWSGRPARKPTRIC